MVAVVSLHIARKIRVRLSPAIIGKFWKNVDRPFLGACWPWKAGRTDRGYGAFPLPGFGMIGAHRLVQAFKTGALHLNETVRHRCDNPLCCNPWHLQGGTQKENVHDSIERGTFNRNQGRKIPAAKQKAIAKAAAAGEPRLSIAVRFKISHRQVYRILQKGKPQ